MPSPSPTSSTSPNASAAPGVAIAGAGHPPGVTAVATATPPAIDARSPEQPVLLFFPLLILLSGAVWSWHFRTANLIPARACLLHLLLAGIVLLAAHVARHLAVVASPTFRQLIWHPVLAAWLVVLNLSAAANYVSRSSWGDPLSGRQIWSFLRHEPLIAEAGRRALAPGPLLGLLAALLALVGSFRVYAWVVRRHPCARWTARLWTPAVLLLAVQVVAVTTLLLRFPADARQEPLIAFFGGAGGVGGGRSLTDLNGVDAHRKIAAALDRQVLASWDPGDRKPATNVILILADSLRADHLPLYGYPRPTTPFLAELAARGELQQVDHAFSTCSESYCGIAASLTGQPFLAISAESTKLHELLARAGYGNQMALVGDHDVFADLGAFYGPTANLELPPDLVAPARAGDDRAVLDWLDRLEPFAGKPQFFYFFLLSSHVLGHRFEPPTWTPDNILAIRYRWNSLRLAQTLLAINRPPTYLQKVVNHYDNGVLQLDGVLRGMFARLAARGYLDDALVLITGDHGDALGEHDHLGHTYRLYNEDIRVPLLLWDSRPDRRIAIAGHASHLDLAPTILDRLDLPIPPTMAGGSLYRPRTTHLSVHHTRRGQQPCAAAIRSAGATRHKLIVCRRRDGAQVASVTPASVEPKPAQTGDSSAPAVPVAIEGLLDEELYDLVADPTESNNLLATPAILPTPAIPAAFATPGSAEPAGPFADERLEEGAALLADLRAALRPFYGDVINTCQTFDCVDPPMRPAATTSPP